MKLVFDTGVWIRWYGKLPLPKSLVQFIESEGRNVMLSTVSIYEAQFKWRLGKLPTRNPMTWLDDSLTGMSLIPPSKEVCLQAADWDWEHRDPFDRMIAATAFCAGAILIHTDFTLSQQKGFSQRYFPL